MFIWPPIKQAHLVAMKWPTIEHLQMIARSNGVYVPATVRLDRWHVLPDDVVLKRSHSEYGVHVILPGIHKDIRTWEYLNENTGKDEFWMAQQYVQSLEQIGEWRVLLLGGHIMSVMHTHKTAGRDWAGDWAATPTTDFCTFQEIRCIPPPIF